MTTPSQLMSGAPSAVLHYQDGAVLGKVLQGGSFTLPEYRTVSSPSVSGGSSNSLGTVPIASGWLYAIASDDASVNEMASFQPRHLFPNDVVAVTVAANVLTVTINGVTVFSVTGVALTVGAALYVYA